MFPDMRPVFDDNVEGAIGAGYMREVFKVRLIGELNLDIVSLELLATRIDIDANYISVREVLPPHLQRGALVHSNF